MSDEDSRVQSEEPVDTSVTADVVESVDEVKEPVSDDVGETSQINDNEDELAEVDENQIEEEEVETRESREGTGEYIDYEDLSKIKARKRTNVSVPPQSQSPKVRRSVDPDSRLDEEESYPIETTDAATKRRQELEARLDRALKKPKIKKRKGEVDLTNDEDELIQILKNQMDNAAKKDAELIENQSGIAVNKIQLLPKVSDILSKANLAEVILDNNLLAEVRQWLEPLPDASLPSYEIQKTLFAALLKLPINTNHLRESGIGKILLFYQKSKRVEPKIKRAADKLISDWTRPIIGASDNYRDKKFHSIDYDSAKHRSILKATADKINIDDSEKSIYEQQAARRNRAAAPVPTVTDYKFAPKSKLDRSSNQSIATAGVGSSLNRDDQFKRINSRLTGRRTAVKKGGVSIEGRGSGV